MTSYLINFLFSWFIKFKENKLLESKKNWNGHAFFSFFSHRCYYSLPWGSQNRSQDGVFHDLEERILFRDGIFPHRKSMNIDFIYYELIMWGLFIFNE